jgi:hypothetical protein
MEKAQKCDRSSPVAERNRQGKEKGKRKEKEKD